MASIIFLIMFYNSYTKKNFSAGSYAYNALLTMITLAIVYLFLLKQVKRKEEGG